MPHSRNIIKRPATRKGAFPTTGNRPKPNIDSNLLQKLREVSGALSKSSKSNSNGSKKTETQAQQRKKAIVVSKIKQKIKEQKRESRANKA